MGFRKDDEITGFILPDGEFVGCRNHDHMDLCYEAFGTWPPPHGTLKIFDSLCGKYMTAFDYDIDVNPKFWHVTEAQAATLKRKGFEEDDDGTWILRYSEEMFEDVNHRFRNVQSGEVGI